MNRHFLSCSIVIIAFLVIVLTAGCFQRSKEQYLVERFILEYPPPDFSRLATSRESIRVERFSVAQAYNTTAMVFRPEAFRLDTYVSSRWSIHPADMINDLLVRDLKSAGLFVHVFSYQSDEPVRYILDGFVDQFYEVDEGPASRAVLSISVILFDRQAGDLLGRLRFQKTFRYSNTLSGKTAEALARGMAANVEGFSTDLIRELSTILK